MHITNDRKLGVQEHTMNMRENMKLKTFGASDHIKSVNVYSCFDKGCPTKFKHTPQCRLTVIVYRYLIQAHEASARRKGKHEYTCLCCFLLSC